MVEKYLAELLATNNRVIVPDFGAFMAKTEGEKKIISFNDFLKYNDGLLVNHIASKENISRDEALAKVKEFVISLQETLKSSSRFPIPPYGTLERDERGGLKFVMTGESNTASTQAHSHGTTKSEPVSSKVELSEPVASKTEIQNQKAEQPKGQQIPPTSPQQSTGGTKPTQPQAKPNVKPGTPPPPPSKSDMPKKSGKKSGFGVLIGVAIVIILAVIAGVLYLNWDEWTGKAEKERIALEQKREKARMDSLAEIERLRADSIREAEEYAAQQEALRKSEKRYHLVAGSFQSRNNAERFVQQLQKQGYPNAEIFMESRGFYRVSYNSFVDRKEAFAEYKRLKEKDIQVWVIRH